MRYLPHTDADVARMLGAIGVGSIDDLFAQIPASLRLVKDLDLPPALDEGALLAHLGELGARNCRLGVQTSFLGAGYSRHRVAVTVDALIQRGEFMTSYTPYQPELSQGTLQAVFEYQTLVAELLGMDVSNASMYDGSTACAEAVLMARRLGKDPQKRPRVLLARTLHPEYRAVVRTYLAGLGVEPEEVPYRADGALDEEALAARLGDDVSCVVAQTPNYFGILEDTARIAELCHARGALLATVTTEPVALALMRPPGQAGADIAVGEAISLALAYPTLGGPGVGMFATRDAFVRAMPGRLVGETVDQEGARGYVLTLAAREQHIRREKATSNICTNTGLIALAFTIHMCLLGRRGFEELGRICYARAEHARERLAAVPGVELAFSGPTFDELPIRLRGRDAREVVLRLAGEGLLAGVPVGDDYPELADTLLVSITECTSPDDIARLCSALRAA